MYSIVPRGGISAWLLLLFYTLYLNIRQREWPQQWPSLLGELDALCRIGETQTELVMFILLRLVEGNF